MEGLEPAEALTLDCPPGSCRGCSAARLGAWGRRTPGVCLDPGAASQSTSQGTLRPCGSLGEPSDRAVPRVLPSV